VSAGRLSFVNGALAARLAATGAVIGRTVNISTATNGETTVVGVIQDFVVDRPDRAPAPMLVRLRREPTGGYIEVRMASDAPMPGTLDAIRATLDRVWPDNRSRQVMLVSDLADAAIADYRARAVLLGLIGALCLPLALAGIAGALSYATSQRLREIGIRVALGAGPRDIRRRVVGRAFVAVSIGLAAGLGGGVLMGRLMSAYLFGVRAVDGWTAVGAVAVLIVTTWVASIVPARRAARVDPATALREGA
jgi:putative ABC transport system permease protein